MTMCVVVWLSVCHKQTLCAWVWMSCIFIIFMYVCSLKYYIYMCVEE